MGCWPGEGTGHSFVLWPKQPCLGALSHPKGWDLPSCRSELAGWDQEPLWLCSSQGSKWSPAWHWCQCEGQFCATMVLSAQESISDGLWEEAALVCAESSVPSPSTCPVLSLQILSKSDFHPQWNHVWCCSTPVFVPAITWNISMCPTLCEHRADPSLLHWTFVKHLRSCVEITAECFGCISPVTVKAQCKCLFWRNLEGVMSLCWRLRGFEFFFSF